MRTILRAAVFGSILAGVSANAGVAECDCEVSVGPAIYFSEDPLVLADENVPYHSRVEEVYYDAGDCVVYIELVEEGQPETYQEGAHEVKKFTMLPHVRQHPAFANLPAELTLTELTQAAREVCFPEDAPQS